MIPNLYVLFLFFRIFFPSFYSLKKDNLLNLRPSLSEDDLYSVSSYIEPREGKEAGPRPDALIDTYLEQTKYFLLWQYEMLNTIAYFLGKYMVKS